jgi:tRNA(Ile)-lysidine synthase
LKIQFEQYIIRHNLFTKDDTVLVAVSGGIDSCVLLHLLYYYNYKCVVTHCNFSLRNTESDKDEQFVRNLANDYFMNFIPVRFNTSEYAEEKGLSIQMAARELRYNFFEEARKKYKCSVIATAHHADDNIETFFINLIRGTGLKGLTGIPIKSNHIVRPLLFASRSEIEDYAKLHNLSWRNDSSNSSNKYTRNKLRHQVLPLLDEIKPGFRKILARDIEHLNETDALLKALLKNVLDKIISINEKITTISIKELRNNNFNKSLLFEIISPYGFNPKQAEKIWISLDSESGKMFYSKNYSLNKDREFIFITKIEALDKQRKFYIDEATEYISEPFELSIEEIAWKNSNTISHDTNVLFADAQTIEFPLIIRRWQAGDFFQPFGMKGFKKLSDFFIDQKISKTEKENIWVVESANRIIWVVDHRLDDRVKINFNTKNVLKLQLL